DRRRVDEAIPVDRQVIGAQGVDRDQDHRRAGGEGDAPAPLTPARERERPRGERGEGGALHGKKRLGGKTPDRSRKASRAPYPQGTRSPRRTTRGLTVSVMKSAEVDPLLLCRCRTVVLLSTLKTSMPTVAPKSWNVKSLSSRRSSRYALGYRLASLSRSKA